MREIGSYEAATKLHWVYYPRSATHPEAQSMTTGPITIRSVSALPSGQVLWDNGPQAVKGLRRPAPTRRRCICRQVSSLRPPTLPHHRPPWLALHAGHGT